MMTEDEISSVTRRPASSGRVSFGEAVVLHETSRTRIVLVPFFIPHSDRTELAIKLITYRRGQPPFEWAQVEEKSISLDGAASGRLLRAVRDHLSIASENRDGDFLVVQVTDGTASLAAHDPALVATALTKVLSSPDIVEHISGVDLSDELLRALRGAIRLSEMRNAVATLRELLERGEKDEQIYQKWCEAHPWAFGSSYLPADRVRAIGAGDKLDLLLPAVISGYRDIVELKRPDMSVMQYDPGHRNFFFSAEASRAIGQCHRYLDVLTEAAAHGLQDHPEIVAYHPRATIVIGRTTTWNDEASRALHGLNRRLVDITVMTYDHLLAQGERIVEMLSTAPPDDEPELDLEHLDPDELPF